MRTEGHESAFPAVQEVPQFNYHTYGLTKREYFAAMAMHGFAHNRDEWMADPDFYRPMAECAVTWADALIEALNKKN